MVQNEKTKAVNAKLALKLYDEGNFNEAFSFAIKANKDDPAIMRIIAFGYLYGNGVEVDEEKGQKFLSSAIEKGDIVALAELGMLYRDGNGGYNQDYEAAERIFREAVEKGSTLAAGQLGWMNYAGLLTGEPDYAKACHWFKIGADGGDEDSIVNLAACYYDGTGVAQNYKTALELYSQASEMNSNVALNMQGWMCEHGEGTEIDIERAISCYQRAIDLGNEQAAINLDNLKKGLGDTFKVLEAARGGDVQAQFDIAYWYYQGENGLPLDYKSARKWYEVATDAGNVGAMHDLGIMFWYGQGGEPDRKHAIELWRTSAEKGNLESLNALGRAYQDEGFRDYDKALQYLRESADKGLIGSMIDLGNLYWDGMYVDRDEKSAYKWYLMAAEAGDAQGQWNVGCMNEHGNGVPVNLGEAEKWFLAAAGQGFAGADKAYERIHRRRKLENANTSQVPVERKRASVDTIKENVRLAKEAFAKNDCVSAFRYALNANHEDCEIQFILGKCLRYGNGVSRMEEEAVMWLSKAAAAGHSEAQAELAHMYHDGVGVGQDYAKAHELFEKSAAARCTSGMVGFGKVLIAGEGGDKDIEKGLSLFRAAADMGNVDAMKYLGKTYLDGVLIHKDVVEGCRFYEMAADVGDGHAHERLGEVYSREEYGVQDYVKAIRHFSCGAALGNTTSMYNLGILYENGYGVRKDAVTAAEWYTKASSAGFSLATDALKRLSNSDVLCIVDKRQNTPYKAFISYRRKGGREYARTLYLELRYRGIKTFFDYTSLQHGDFSADILKAIEEAPNFIMMVTDGAFERCSDENDWVRKEIEYARRLGKNIVPVAPSGHQQDLSLLPDSLADIRGRQVFRLDMENLFEESVGKIVKECLKGI